MTTKTLGNASVSGGIARTQYTIPSDELVGDFTLTGTYNQNDNYKEASANADFKVRIATTITVDNVTGNHGESSTFTAHVKYDNTVNVNEGQVQFTLGSTIIGTGNVSNGVATVDYTIPSSVETGTSISANYLGTNTYGTSATLTNGTLKIRTTPTVTVDAVSANRDSTAVLRAYVENSSGTVITTGSVEFYIDDTKVATTNVTNPKSDKFEYSYNVPNNATAGTHTIRAVFIQDDDYTTSNGTANLTVRMPTHIVAPAVSGNGGATVNLVASIYDENDAIVTSGQAKFKQNDTVIINGTVSVGNNGTATKQIVIPLSATEGSTIQYTVEYVENNNYTASASVTITVTVRKTPVLVVNDVTANRGDVVYLSASVTDSSDNDVNEGTLTFTLDQTT